jgi:hypothetical protein
MDPSLQNEHVSEPEPVPGSPRNLVFERLQTEYGEEEEILENELVTEEVMRWVEFCAAVLGCLIVLQVREFYPFRLAYSVIPIIVYEGKCGIDAALQIRLAHRRKSAFKNILSTVCNLSFWALIISYLETYAFNFLFVLVPLSLFLILSLCLKTGVHLQCQSFSNIVLTT